MKRENMWIIWRHQDKTVINISYVCHPVESSNLSCFISYKEISFASWESSMHIVYCQTSVCNHVFPFPSSIYKHEQNISIVFPWVENGWISSNETSSEWRTEFKHWMTLNPFVSVERNQGLTLERSLDQGNRFQNQLRAQCIKRKHQQTSSIRNYDIFLITVESFHCISPNKCFSLM